MYISWTILVQYGFSLTIYTSYPTVIWICDTCLFNLTYSKKGPQESHGIHSVIYQFATLSCCSICQLDSFYTWNYQIPAKRSRGNENEIIAEWLPFAISLNVHCVVQLICTTCQKQWEKMTLEIWDCMLQIWWNEPQLRSYMASLSFYKRIILAG